MQAKHIKKYNVRENGEQKMTELDTRQAPKSERK